MYVCRLNSLPFCIICFTVNVSPDNNVPLRYPFSSAIFIVSAVFGVPNSRYWPLCRFRMKWALNGCVITYSYLRGESAVSASAPHISILLHSFHLVVWPFCFFFIVSSTILVFLYVTESTRTICSFDVCVFKFSTYYESSYHTLYRRVRKLRIATLSFVMPACPSVRIEQLGFQWTDFHEISYLGIFLKFVEKI